MPRKTAIFQDEVFDPSFVNRLGQMGYDAVRGGERLLEHHYREIDDSTADFVNPDGVIPIFRLRQESDISRLEAVLQNAPQGLEIEIVSPENWSPKALQKVHSRAREYEYEHPVFWVSSVSFRKPAHCRLYTRILALKALGFQIRARWDQCAANETLLPGGRYFEKGFVVNSVVPLVGPCKYSVVIPVYNNRKFVLKVLDNLASIDRKDFEVILVDDGSSDGLQKEIPQTPYAFQSIFVERDSQRKMGDLNYRAGLARNIGVGHASGEYLVFLDSDILVARNFFEILDEEMLLSDLVMCRRYQLTPEFSRTLPSYRDVSEAHLEIEDGGYWEEFYRDPRGWQERRDKWKYVCTHSLCLRKSLFQRVGGISNNYNVYGYEDVELGYRVARLGGRFLLSKNTVYHLSPTSDRSEFARQQEKRNALLSKSAQVFFQNTLDPAVFLHGNVFWRHSLPWLRLQTVLSILRLWLGRFV